ncbi:MAG: chaperone modulator CbpM [Chromatiaceae bacterium]|jgi:chaperone modulatory protein CbpM|nr:chaperone modulator CbpM [Chromatiaceae bacterium]
MTRNQTQPLSGQILDEGTEITLVELCRSCDIRGELIEAMVEQGILEPAGRRGSHWCFPASSLRRTRVTLHLQRDLGVNLAGAALALDLLDRIDELNARLRALYTERKG